MSTLTDLQAQARDLKLAIEEAQRAERKARQAAYDAYVPEYRYYAAAEKGRIVREIVNWAEFEALDMDGVMYMGTGHKQKVISVQYFLTDEGILTHRGGGYCILNDPKLCTDEEYERICQGDIPERFFR